MKSEEHAHNKHTPPPSYGHLLEEEGAVLLDNIKRGIEGSLAAGDLYRGIPYYTRALNRHLDFKYGMGDDDKIHLITLFFKLMDLPDLPIHLQAKWAKVVVRLLKKSKELKIDISWKKLLSYLTKVVPFPSSTNTTFNGRGLEKLYLYSIIGLIKKSRRHFGDTATDEIFTYFRPYFSPHDNIIFTAQSLLCLFVPTTYTSPHTLLLRECFTVWEWVESTPDWDLQWVVLLARWAKHHHEDIDWTEYLPLLFQHFLGMFDLSLGGGTPILKPTKHNFPMEAAVFLPWHKNERKFGKMAEVIVYLLTGTNGSKDTQLFLDQLMTSIGSYFHPSNSGEWTESLAHFLESLCTCYTKRVGGGDKSDRSDKSDRGDKKPTHESVEAFVNSVLPSLRYALYAKRDSLSAAAVRALLQLAYIAPDIIFPQFLDKFCEALETPAAHQTRAALETLAILVHPLLSHTVYPKGVAYLPTLLNLTLPGIDVNDDDKTTSTFKFYYRFFTTISLHEVLPGGDAITEYDIDAREATHAFLDWACMFIERTFIYLSNMEQKSNKSSHTTFDLLFKPTMELFFMQLSPAIFEQVLKRVYTRVIGTGDTNTIKEVGQICGAAGYAQPTPTLKLFIPHTHKMIVGDSGRAHEKRTDEELQWSLTMLAYIVHNAGKALLPYEAQLKQIVSATIDSSTVKVYKAANKVVKSLLHSLTQYYPTDYHSVNAELWDSKDFANTHIQNWGSTSSNHPVAWHEPSKEEYQYARQLIDVYLNSSLEDLSVMVQNNEKTPFKREQACRHLSRLRAILRGGSAFFVSREDSTDPQSRRLLEENVDDRGWYHLKTPIPVVHARVDSSSSVLASEIREKIGRLTHQWIIFLTHQKTDEISCTKLICKISFNVVANFGVADSRVMQRRRVLSSLRNKWRAHHDRKMKTRNFVVMKAYNTHLRRLAEAAYHTPQDKWVDDIHNGLLSLSFSSYTDIRKRAQMTLIAALKRHPINIKKIAADLISRLGNQLAEQDELAGAMHLLMSKTFLRRTASDWSLRRDFATAIAACAVRPQWRHTTQSYFMRLLATFCVQFKYLPLKSPQPSSSHKNLHPNTQRVLEDMNATAENSFVKIVETLAPLLDDKSITNWRFQMMAATLLSWYTQNITEDGGVIARVHKPLVGGLRWMIRALACETPPLRAVAVRFVTSIFRGLKGDNHNSPYKEKNFQRWNNQDTPIPMDIDTSTSTSTFTSNNNSNSHVVSSGGGVMTSSGLLKTLLITGDLELRQPAFVKLFIEYLADDHPIKTGESEDREDPMVAALKKRFHFLGRFTDVASVLGQFMGTMTPNQQQEATGNMLGELLKTDRQWPYTRTALAAADGFNTLNARLFKGLFKVYGLTYFETVEGPLKKLLGSTDRASQCTAAEILAGAIRAHTYSSVNVSNSHTKSIHELFFQGLAAAPPDCIVDWMTSIRFAFYNRTPVVASWLTDHLLHQHAENTSLQTSSSPFSTASAQAKPLYFLKAALAEFTWRSVLLHETLIVHLVRLLDHPYKQLRQEIAEILAMIIGFSWKPAHDITNRPLLGTAPVVPEHVTKFMKEVLTVLTELELSHDADPTNTQLLLTRTHTRATVLHLLLHAFTQANAAPLKPLLSGFVPHLFSMQTDTDQDVAREARQTSAVVAQAVLSPVPLGTLSAGLVSNVVTSASWKVRSALLPFIQILAYNHVFMLREHDTAGDIYNIALLLLADPQIEVRELARVALSSLLKSYSKLGPTHLTIETLIDRFTKLADTRISRQSPNPADVLIRHQGVLGLAAIVGSQPYSMPGWLPAVLVALAKHVSDPMPIAETVRKTFMEFWRTHQDTWQEEQNVFDEHQLSSLKELLVSPSYYA